MTLRERAVEELMDDLNGELYAALGQLGRGEIDKDQFYATYDRLLESRMVKISHREIESEGLDYFGDRRGA